MAMPSVSDTARRVWESLPQVYRTYDEQQQDYPLLRFISLMADQLDDVNVLLARIDRQGPDEGGPLDNSSSSDLADPVAADDEWLPWLAALSGLPWQGRTTAELRSLIANSGRGTAIATRAAMQTAAKTRLSGAKFVDIVPQAKPAGAAGGRWDVLVRTRGTETVSGSDVLDAISDAGAKPAGVTLWHEFYGASYATVVAAYPTIGAVAGKTIQQVLSS